MKTPFVVYCQAVGWYALLTLPAMSIPVMYIISLMYVLMYGWFAWFVFTLLYVVIDNLPLNYILKLSALFATVIVSVAFAFYMIGVLDWGENIWNSGYLIFPFAAVVAGWISAYVSSEKIGSSCTVPEKNHTIGQ
jgi:hypothetical protein